LNDIIITSIATLLGLFVGNYLFKFFADKNYTEATKISFFQAIAVSVLLFNLKEVIF